MDKRTLTTIIVILVVFFGLLGLAMLSVHFGARRGTFTTKTRFTAKPGATREKSVVLSRKSESKAPDRDDDKGPYTADTHDTRYEEPEPQETYLNPAEALTASIIRGAMGALTPEAGIAQLQTHLSTLEDVDAAAQIYAAMGTLYARADAPEVTRAEEAFAAGAALAESAEIRQKVACEQARTLLLESYAEEAARVADSALSNEESITNTGLELRLVQASAYEQLERWPEAEAAYKRAMEDAEKQLREPDSNAETILRTAGLRLARLYRSRGDEEKAKAVSDLVRSTLTQ